MLRYLSFEIIWLIMAALPAVIGFVKMVCWMFTWVTKVVKSWPTEICSKYLDVGLGRLTLNPFSRSKLHFPTPSTSSKSASFRKLGWQPKRGKCFKTAWSLTVENANYLDLKYDLDPVPTQTKLASFLSILNAHHSLSGSTCRCGFEIACQKNGELVSSSKWGTWWLYNVIPILAHHICLF